MKKFLFNPFIKIAGFQALELGLLLMLVGALLAGLCRARFDGVLDIHFFMEKDYAQPFLDQFVIWVVLVVVFHLAGLISGARPRLVDTAGTFALARAPYALLPLMNVTGNLSDLSMQIKDSIGEGNKWPFTMSESLGLIIPGVMGLLFAIWLVVLYLNAYKVSTNLKGGRLTISFISGLLLAEILSIVLIRVLLNN